MLEDHVEVDEMTELNSPRSCTTMSTSYTGFGSATSQELDDIAEAVSQFYEDGALWQRTIPRGRRCKPLSFAGVILYDEYGNLLPVPQDQEQEMDEYFSPQRNLAAAEEAFRS